jgi:L-lactate dehydrogenase (cytochrome)
VLTLDLQVLGQRHKDLKNGLTAPPKLTLANIINMATKPRWCLGMAGHQAPAVRQPRRPRQGRERHGQPGRLDGEQFDPRLNWGDVEWIKKRWGGKLILKGIHGRRRRRLAADSGADAHDRQQPRRAPARRRRVQHQALPAIVAAVGSRSRCGWTAASAAARTC